MKDCRPNIEQPVASPRMTDRQPAPAFWLTVALVAVLVGYPLSMGPYWWLCHQIRVPHLIRSAADAFYDPVWEAHWSGPEWIRQPIRSYADSSIRSPRRHL